MEAGAIAKAFEALPHGTLGLDLVSLRLLRANESHAAMPIIAAGAAAAINGVHPLSRCHRGLVEGALTLVVRILFSIRRIRRNVNQL